MVCIGDKGFRNKSMHHKESSAHSCCNKGYSAIAVLVDFCFENPDIAYPGASPFCRDISLKTFNPTIVAHLIEPFIVFNVLPTLAFKVAKR